MSAKVAELRIHPDIVAHGPVCTGRFPRLRSKRELVSVEKRVVPQHHADTVDLERPSVPANKNVVGNGFVRPAVVHPDMNGVVNKVVAVDDGLGAAISLDGIDVL